MPTGDGLLVRLRSSVPIPVDSFIALCEASQRYGNGTIEVTQRGSVQIRGLTELSAAGFARVVAALPLADRGAPSIVISPLLGFDAKLHDFVAELHGRLARRPYSAVLAPKVSVLIDSDAKLHLDDVPADIRLRATSEMRCHLALGGNAHEALHLGSLRLEETAAAVDTLLAWIASHGRTARICARECLARIDAIRMLLGPRLTLSPPLQPRAPAEPIGEHLLEDGGIALGFGLAFGYATAAELERLARAAAASGANAICPTASRALIVFGVSADRLEGVRSAAAGTGLIVQPHDPRRHVIACAGAPSCNSARMSTRALASAVTEAAAPLLDGSVTVHLSGCGKGCAHPAAAALTIVGPEHLVVGGAASDAPHGTVPQDKVVTGIEYACRMLLRDRDAGEQSADVFRRVGPARIVEWLGAGTDR